MSSSMVSKKRKNAPFSFTASNILSAGQNIVSKAAECTIKRPCFQYVFSISKISLQMVSECTYHLFFKIPGYLDKDKTCAVFLIAVSNIVSKNVIIYTRTSLFQMISFQIPSECTFYRPCFRNFLCSSKSFQIPPECTICRPCFHIFLCSSKSFQIPSECTIYRPCSLSFLCSSNLCQVPSEFTVNFPCFPVDYPRPHAPLFKYTSCIIFLIAMLTIVKRD